ncbi:MAG: type II toxin-antitoxin system VapC family toxin [Steroidobacteraceae bacterium]
MRLLLDTHALLWWLVGAPELSAGARAAMGDPANEIYVSAATAWEIATKSRRGKLHFQPGEAQRLGESVAAEGFRPLALTAEHGLRAGSYLQSHGDPFDRMLAAQCEMEDLTLVTRDPAFRAFPCRTLW